MLKSLAFAIIALCCSIGIAAAQEAAPQGQGLNPDQIKRLLSQRGSLSNPTALSGGGADTAAPGAVPIGWNFFHALYCQWYSPDVNNNYLFVYPTTGGFWFVRNNIYAASVFLSGCVNGNWEAVHVINSTTGEFDSNYTYSYK
jgi:hypothetical protein